MWELACQRTRSMSLAHAERRVGERARLRSERRLVGNGRHNGRLASEGLLQRSPLGVARGRAASRVAFARGRTRLRARTGPRTARLAAMTAAGRAAARAEARRRSSWSSRRGRRSAPGPQAGHRRQYGGLPSNSRAHAHWPGTSTGRRAPDALRRPRQRRPHWPGPRRANSTRAAISSPEDRRREPQPLHWQGRTRALVRAGPQQAPPSSYAEEPHASPPERERRPPVQGPGQARHSTLIFGGILVTRRYDSGTKLRSTDRHRAHSRGRAVGRRYVEKDASDPEGNYAAMPGRRRAYCV